MRLYDPRQSSSEQVIRWVAVDAWELLANLAEQRGRTLRLLISNRRRDSPSFHSKFHLCQLSHELQRLF